MTAKKRKPLDEAVEQFVFSNNQEIAPAAPLPTVQSTPVPITQPQSDSSEVDLMNKLQLPEKEPTVRFTVDMPESLHRKLSILAAKTRRKKVEIVRMLLENGLKDVDD